jgi:hypothetical protein
MTCKVEGEVADGVGVRVAVEAVAWVRVAEEERAVALVLERAASEWEGRACVPSAVGDRTMSLACRACRSAVPSAEPRSSARVRRTTRSSSVVAPRALTKASEE